MAERTPFLLRLDPEILAALRKWADDDLRSLNGQIEFLLRRSLRDAGRIKSERGERSTTSQSTTSQSTSSQRSSSR